MRTIYLLLVALFLLSSCRDEPLLPDDEIGEGTANVSLTLDYKDFTPGNLGSRASGTAIEKINTLWVVAFDATGKLVFKEPITKWKESTNTQRPPDGETSAQPSTMKVSFDMKMNYGKYYMYAVANVDLSGVTIENQSDLKDIQFTWQSDVAANNQMYGYFTLGDGSNDNAESLDAAPIIINRSTVSIHSWIKRLASKVTVDYDGTNLKEGVIIFLKSVKIKDIPKTCYLGKNNTPTSASELDPEGEGFYYYDTKQYPNWPEGCTFTPATWPNFISDGHPYLDGGKFDGSRLDFHQSTSDALYFYENMQGIGKDKAQDADKNGSIDYPDGNHPEIENSGFKDEKRCGTYIEVEAYYSSKNSAQPGQGRIIYRFMLGKNISDNYDAQRNYHYKVTLVFNGFANDVDWHIEYEKPPIGAPVPYYISYLYNRTMMCPIEVNAGTKTIRSITAYIENNPWYPDGGTPGTGADGGDYWGPMALYGQNQWNGFLSLFETKRTIVGYKPGQTGPKTDSNRPYYLGHDWTGAFAYPDSPNRGTRVYDDMSEGAHSSSYTSSTDRYYVKIEKDLEGNNIYHISLPMYTRAKQLIKNTSYTGNNPFVSYMRLATVNLTVTYTDGTSDKMPIKIRQVRRVVNPKGVWRSYDKTDGFHVVLKTLLEDNSTKFTDILSDGPWKAYVVGSSKNREMLSLSGGNKVANDTVYGLTGTKIDFNIAFRGTIPESQKDEVSRHAVVRVEYNNYTCEHLIFCRQGYAPVALIQGGARWESFNRVTKTQHTSSPLEEGSLFKMGNWGQPIDAKNNQSWGQPWTTPSAELKPWVDISPDDFLKNAPAASLIIRGGTDTSWGKISTYSKTTGFDDPDNNVRVATLEDWQLLYKNMRGVITAEQGSLEQGYGVLYGDGATETADDITVAYGYNYYRSDRQKCGMRGCFVYNHENGINLFFPIGQSGYGHRKQRFNGAGSSHPGILRYSCNNRWGYMESSIVGDRPLFYGIFKAPGAVYWFQKEGKPDMNIFNNDSDVKDAAAWDFNYLTFDFYPISYGNIASGDNSDACFIRCVRK